MAFDNPFDDILGASAKAMTHSLSRTPEQRETEGAVVVMILTQAHEKVREAKAKLREEHIAEQEQRLQGSMKKGTPEWDALIEDQAIAMASLNRLMARVG